MLALCSLIIVWPCWPQVVATSKGHCKDCLQQCQVYRGAGGGHREASLMWETLLSPAVGEVSSAVAALRSFVAPGKPKSTAGASRR